MTTTLNAGEITGMMLESGGARPRQISRDELIETFLDTRRYWRLWLDRSTYTGRWREMVTRSAMTLKLMTYAPTGALVAAPDVRAAGTGRRRAQLGLPLHLGARRVVLGVRAARPRLHRREPKPSCLG